MGRRHPPEQPAQRCEPLAAPVAATHGSLAGGTLEDYFSATKPSGLVSQHLLGGSAEHDAMAAERLGDSEGRGELEAAREPDRALATADAKEPGDADRMGHDDDDEPEAAARQADGEPDVSGMTLSEYLHVQDEEGDARAQDKVASSGKRPGSLQQPPPPLADKKKAAAPADVSGMSLDLYLGASSPGSDERKASPKLRRRGGKPKQLGPALPQAKASPSPFSVKGSSLSHVLLGPPGANSAPQPLSSDEEGGSTTLSSPSAHLTPFQRRQKRKDRAKQRQQQQQQQQRGSSVSKAILLADSSSSSATALPHKGREKRKATQHPPLPKLLSPSPSVSSVGHKNHDSVGHKDHDSSHPSNDSDANEKLPPL